MRLVACKCPNCGAKIKLEKGKKVYSCSYCRYDILLDDNGELDLDHMNLEGIDIEKFKKTFKAFSIIPIVMFFLIFGVFIIIFINVISQFLYMNESSTTIEKTNDETEIFIQKANAGNFNFFIDEIGIKYDQSVTNIIEHTMDNLNKYDNEILITYLNKEYKTIDELMNLTLSIDNDEYKQYKITNEKDNDGYINKIIIEVVE